MFCGVVNIQQQQDPTGAATDRLGLLFMLGACMPAAVGGGGCGSISLNR